MTKKKQFKLSPAPQAVWDFIQSLDDHQRGLYLKMLMLNPHLQELVGVLESAGAFSSESADLLEQGQ